MDSAGSTEQILPPDDPRRSLSVADPEAANATHLGIAGDTYTVLITGEQTGGRLCVIDMHVPPSGGPPPHRHGFEETFVILEGEIEVTFRGAAHSVRAGQTANIPSNAPHHFRNNQGQPARLLCICSPAGLDEFFALVGAPVSTRTAPPPRLSEAGQAAAIARLVSLAPRFKTEILGHP